MAASQGGDYDIAELLIRSGADPAVSDKDGQTALDIAVNGGHDTIVQLLKHWYPDQARKPLDRSYDEFKDCTDSGVEILPVTVLDEIW